jgi:hypothetical protein
LQADVSRQWWFISRMTIRVRSNRRGASKLSVAGYGNLKYRSKTNDYYNRFWIFSKVSAATIKSDSGASITVPLVSGSK